MKTWITSGAAVLASTAIAGAGGVERSAQSMAILFEQGTYAELGYSFVSPDVSGVSVFEVPVGPISAGQNSGDMAPSYSSVSLSYRQDLTDQLSFAFVLDKPIGADVNYPTGTGYLYGGSVAEITSTALSAYLRYEMQNNVSVFGGLRAVEADGTVALFNGYTLDASGSTELGYAVGVAYERPDIALRVSVTYFSATDHQFDSVESGTPTTGFETTIPQAVNLEFQSGIAQDTLLFGSVRWVDWSEFDIAPPAYVANTQNINKDPLVEYNNDTITYTLGLGRRFNETWSGAFSVIHEPSGGGYSGNLGPIDGRTGVGLGLTWASGTGLEITGGVQYSRLGDATTAAPTAFTAGAEVPFAEFRDNTSFAAGLRIGYQF